MAAFLLALVSVPVLLGLTWIYTSPLPRLDGFTWLKVVIRIVLFVLIFACFLESLNFVAQRVPPNTRRFYLMGLLVIEAIPMLWILFYRYYRNPSLYGGPVTGIEPEHKQDE